MAESGESEFEADRAAADLAYAAALSSGDAEAGDWLTCRCPDCDRDFALQWPESTSHAARTISQSGRALQIVCVYVCEERWFRDLADFVAPVGAPPARFDDRATCICGVSWAFDGVALGCPACGAYGFLRDFLTDRCDRIVEEARGATDRKTLSRCLQDLVGFFDGVMRAQLLLVDRNHRLRLAQHLAEPDGEPAPPPNPLPARKSFQNLAGARTALLPAHDLAAGVHDDDWKLTERAFQKRHLFAHALGVVDQDYLNKTHDTTASLGKQVPLDLRDIVTCAQTLRAAGTRFFGFWLS